MKSLKQVRLTCRAYCEYVAMQEHVVSLVVDENEYSNVGTPDCLEKYLKTKVGPAFCLIWTGRSWTPRRRT